MKIYSEKDVYAAVAQAIHGRDISLIDEIMIQTRDWLEPDDINRARNDMLEAVYELLLEVE